MAASSPFTKSLARWLLALSFSLAITLPLGGWVFPGTPDPDLELVENRTPATLPKWPLTLPDWKNIPHGLESYWNDAFGFRASLVRGNAIVNAPFGIAANPSVVLARGDWLFYTGDYTLDQFRGIRPLSDVELDAFAATLEARRRWLERSGAHFLFVIAPEKGSVYPELVPARFGPRGRTPADQVIDYLHAHTGIDVLDLRVPVTAARSDGDVYLRTDTHWNDRGAFAGYRAVVARLAQWYPTMTARSEADFTRQRSAWFVGDLGLMLGNFDRKRRETTEEWTARSAPPTRLGHPQAPPQGSQNYVEFAGAADRPRLVVFHDSFFVDSEERVFANHARPSWAPVQRTSFRLRDLLAEQFSRATFSWQDPFDVAFIKREHPNVVIEELTERKLTYSLTGDKPPRE